MQIEGINDLGQTLNITVKSKAGKQYLQFSNGKRQITKHYEPKTNRCGKGTLI